jgi:hypothetical protein
VRRFARGYAGCDIGILQLFISIGQLSFVLGFVLLFETNATNGLVEGGAMVD